MRFSLLLLFTLSSLACGRKGSVVDRATDLPHGYELRMANVNYQRLGKNGLITEANTAEVLLGPRSGALRFSRIEIEHHMSGSDREAAGLAHQESAQASKSLSHIKQVRIIADSGEANLYSGRFSLRGAVRLDDGAGQVLDAPSAAFDPDSHSFAGAGPASLRGPNYVINADQGYVVDSEKNTVDLMGPVRGAIEPTHANKL